MTPLQLSEAFYAWGFRTKLFRQLTWASGFGAAAYGLQHQLYTSSHSWTWWLELAGFVLCFAPCAVLLAFAVKTVLTTLFTRPARALRRLPWDRLFSFALIGGLAVTLYGFIDPGYDHTVASTTAMIAAGAAVIAALCYFAVKATFHSNPHPLGGTWYADSE